MNQTIIKYSLGILLFFYSDKSPTRLFVVPCVTVKPFDDVVAGYTSLNSVYKRYEKFQCEPTPVYGYRLNNTNFITYPPYFSILFKGIIVEIIVDIIQYSLYLYTAIRQFLVQLNYSDLYLYLPK